MSGTTERARWAIRFEPAFLAAFWALFCALAFLFPYTGDDWAWGSRIGVHRLDHWFRDYNGRYAGDLVVLALVRTPWLTPLVMAAVVTVSLFLVLDLAGRRTPLGYTAAAVLFLAMPRAQWTEAVAWLSGFSNYAFGTLCLLVFLWATKRDWTGRLGSRRVIARRVGVLLLAVVSTLFVENITVYLVLAGAAVVLASARRRRAAPVDALYWLVGFLAGAAWMFSNGEYRRAQHAGHGYHRVEHAGIGHKLSRIFGNIARMTFGANLLLGIVLVLLVCVLAVGAFERIGRVAGTVMIALAGLYLASTWTLELLYGREALGPWRVLSGVAGLVLLALLCAAAGASMTDPDRRLAVYACCVSVLVLVVPLAFVNPVGPRCFYCTYFLLLLAAALLFTEAGDRSLVPRAPALASFAGAAAVALFAGYLAVYGAVDSAVDDRLARIRTAVADGASTVRVARLPFTDFVHLPDPTRGVAGHRFKLFYHLPKQLQIVLEPPRRSPAPSTRPPR